MSEIKGEYRSGSSSRDDRYEDDGRTRRRSGRREVRALTGTSLDVTREAARLARAYTEANAEIWIGATRVVGGLLGDLTESLVGGYRADEDDDDYDEADEADEARGARDSDRRDSRRGSSTQRGLRGMRGPTRDIARSVSDAIREAARVAQRSADRFTRVYEDRSPHSEEESLAREDYGPEPGEGGRSRSRQEGSAPILNEKGQPMEKKQSSVEIKTEKKG